MTVAPLEDASSQNRSNPQIDEMAISYIVHHPFQASMHRAWGLRIAVPQEVCVGAFRKGSLVD